MDLNYLLPFFAFYYSYKISDLYISISKTDQNIDEIYLVTNSEYIEKVKEMTQIYSKVISVVKGGATRKDSSYNGILSIKHTEGNVLIHDGVRPMVSDRIINECIKKLKHCPAVCTTIDSTDTVYITNDDGFITDIPNRKLIRRAQTPQCFKLSLIKKTHELANNDPDCVVTDDCGLIHHYKLANIKTIDGDTSNIKITYQDDIEFAKKYL